MMDEVEVIKCVFEDINWINFGDQYSLIIENQKLESDKEYQFDVSECRNVNEVLGIFIEDCNMPSVPLNFPWHQFPNVKVIEIKKSNLTAISKEDFEGLAKENLTEIWFRSNKIEHLPGDLFEGMNKLEKASFYDNKIKYIDAELVPTLMKLKFLDFEGNINISKEYAVGSDISAKKEIMVSIFDNCQMPDDVREKINLKLAYRKVTYEKRNIQKENLQLKEKVANLTKKMNELQKSGSADMKNALSNETFKDFTITVNDREFKVHKFLLVARSPVLAEMIQNNPDASALKLEHIPTEIFERVLDFLYNDTLPQDGATFKDIFIAAGRLKIEKLKNFAGDKLVDQVNEENACEMFALSNKYLHKRLRIKAFEEVNKILDGEGSEMPSDDPNNAQKRNQNAVSKKFEEAFKNIKM